MTCQNQSVYSNAEGRFTVNGVDNCEAVSWKKPASYADRGSHRGLRSRRSRSPSRAPWTPWSSRPTRTETTPEQAAVAANVITEQQLEARQFPMLFDVLRDIPGLQVDEYGPPGALAEVFTRGADYTGTLVLLDGVPLNDPGGECISRTSPEGLDRVEVVRGPESALFGAEAAAGVIQLFTKHGDPEDYGSAWLGFLRARQLSDRPLDRQPRRRPSIALRLFAERVGIPHRRRVAEHLLPQQHRHGEPRLQDLGLHAIARRLPHLRRHRRASPARSPTASTIRFPMRKRAITLFRCAWTTAGARIIQQQFTFGYHRLERSIQRQRALRRAAAGGAGSQRSRAAAGYLFRHAGESVRIRPR